MTVTVETTPFARYRTEDFNSLDNKTLLDLIGKRVVLEGIDSDDRVMKVVIGTVTSILTSPENVSIAMENDSGLSWDTDEYYARISWVDESA